MSYLMKYVSNNKLLLCIALGITLVLFYVPEVHAFSTPLVKAANSIQDHMIKAGLAFLIITFLFFVYTLCMGSPNWKMLGCVIGAAALLIGIAAIKEWLLRMN